MFHIYLDLNWKNVVAIVQAELRDEMPDKESTW